MIITLTVNPSLDRTVRLATPLVPGEVHRIVDDRTGPGGKGINVALGVARAGLKTLAVFPAAPSDPLIGLLNAAGLPHRATSAGGKVRTNLTIVSEPDVTTKVNEPGETRTAAQIETLEDALVDVVVAGDVVMLSGSLGQGVPDDEYARLVSLVRDKGAWVGVDTSDEPLLALAQQFDAAAPDFLKPNAQELGQLTGRDGAEFEQQVLAGDFRQVTAAARALHDAGVAEVLVTLGGAGAVLVTDEGAWYAPTPRVPVVSTVGAGDSSVAGYLIAREQGGTPAQRLALAVAYGAVAVTLAGTTIPARDQVQPDVSVVAEL